MIRTLFLTAVFAFAALPAQAASSYFQVAAEDVGAAVGQSLAARGAGDQVKATVSTGNAVMYEADKPLSVAIQALTFDQKAKTWQANMYILSKGETVSVSPIQGRYEQLINVPTLTRNVNSNDVITKEDITMKYVEAHILRKDSVTNADDIIGKSPRHSISPDRPVRLSEVNLPALVKKGQHVSVTYTAANMKIQTVGEALEDGTLGSMVRIKNVDTKRAFSARVVSDNQVEANLQTM